MRVTYLLVLIVIFLSSVSTAGFVVSPSYYNLNLTAGDTTAYSFTITWDGPETVMGFINTNVTPDNEGIYVYYSKNPVILYPGKTTVNVTVYTAQNLVPRTYNISSEVYTSVDDYYKNLSFDFSLKFNQANEKLNDSMSRIWHLSDELNETLRNLSLSSDTNERLQQIISDIISLIKDMKESLEAIQTTAEESRQPTIERFLIFIIIALVIITGGALTLLYIERKKAGEGKR